MNVQTAHLAAVHPLEQLEFGGKIGVWLNMQP